MGVKDFKHSEDYKIDVIYIENMLNKIYKDLTKWRKRLLRNRKRTYRSKKQKKTSRKRPGRKFKQKYLKGGDSLNNIGGSSGNKYYK